MPDEAPVTRAVPLREFAEAVTVVVMELSFLAASMCAAVGKVSSRKAMA
jgi:hypothetical protein